VTQDSVQSDLHFGDHKTVLATPDLFEREVFYVLPLPGEPAAVVIPGGTPPARSDDRVTTGPNTGEKRIEARRVWLVTPAEELPIDAKTRLEVVPGLRSYAGPLLGIERRTVVAFDTFPEFRFIGVRCTTGVQPLRQRLARFLRPGCRTGNQGASDPDTRFAQWSH
jgi:hypothetical protein